MSKFWALVGNENLKIRRKKLLWIALAIIIVASFFLSAVLGLFSHLSALDTVFSEPFADFCQKQIDSANEEIERLESKKRSEQNKTDEENEYIDTDIRFYQGSLAQYELLRDSGADWNDWRYTSSISNVYADAVKSGDTELADYLKSMILTNDYCEYYRYLIAENEKYQMPEQLEAANAGYRYCLEHKIAPDESDWRYRLALDMGDALRNGDNDSYLLIQYRLEHNVSANPGDSFGGSEATALIDSATVAILSMLELSYTNTSPLWNALVATLSLSSVVQIFCIILAASMVASEFGKGTIKFLLITPASRWKILLSKYVALLLNMCIFFFTMLFCNLAFCCLFCGGKDIFLPIVSVSEGVIKHSSPILLLLRNYLLGFVSMIVMATFAFAVSSLFRNSGIAVGICLLIMYSGSTINSILALGSQIWGFLDFGRYLIFANLDLVKILDGTALFPHQSFGVAIVVLALHMAVFLLTAFDAFDRKEI